jgi:hypothetical protein
MGDTRGIMFLEKRTDVINREYEDSQAIFTVKIGRRQLEQLLAQGGAKLTIDGLRPHEAIARHWGNGKVEVPMRVPLHEKHVGQS